MPVETRDSAQWGAFSELTALPATAELALDRTHELLDQIFEVLSEIRKELVETRALFDTRLG
jgi:hypothetical protein